MAHVFIGEAEFFRAEQQSGGRSREVLVQKPACGFQAMEGQVEVAMACRRGSHNERAIGYRRRNVVEDLSLLQNLMRANCGAGFLKGDVIRIDQPEMGVTEIAHRARGGADVERITRRNENNPKRDIFESPNCIGHYCSK